MNLMSSNALKWTNNTNLNSSLSFWVYLPWHQSVKIGKFHSWTLPKDNGRKANDSQGWFSGFAGHACILTWKEFGSSFDLWDFNACHYERPRNNKSVLCLTSRFGPCSTAAESVATSHPLPKMRETLHQSATVGSQHLMLTKHLDGQQPHEEKRGNFQRKLCANPLQGKNLYDDKSRLDRDAVPSDESSLGEDRGWQTTQDHKSI